MDTKDIKIVAALLCVLFFFYSCKKDDGAGKNNNIPVDTHLNVLIACEGSLGNGNAAFSVYSKDKDSVYEDVYESVNHQPLGDIFQSITKIGSAYFLCINNSDKIVVLNTSNWLQQAVISIPKPRYILPVSATKAYVSTLFSNKVYVVNTASYQVEKQITMPYNNPEGMMLSGNTALVCTWDTACNKIYTIDTGNDTITDSLTIPGFAPQDMLRDKEGKVWVMSGNSPKGKSAFLTRFDITTKAVLKSYSFAKGIEAIKPVFNVGRDTIYFIEVNYNGGSVNNGVFRMRIDDAALPPSPFILCSTYQYFWALGIDPSTNNIFVGDPKGFTQKGGIAIYRTDGSIVKQFNVGVGPGHFYFN